MSRSGARKGFQPGALAVPISRRRVAGVLGFDPADGGLGGLVPGVRDEFLNPSSHGARPACCSRIPSWDTVNRYLEGVASTGSADEDGVKARVGVFYGPLIAAAGLRGPGGWRRSPGYCSRLRRSSSSSSSMRARAVSSRARAASTRASAASSSARAVSAWDWAAWARAPAVRIPKVGR